VSDVPPERDAGLETFVDAIEAALRARRGKDHVLSPHDFALARGWHGAGVSLATVLVAIDEAFESIRPVARLLPPSHRGAGGGLGPRGREEAACWWPRPRGPPSASTSLARAAFARCWCRCASC
jgi:hypothetical protein